jgi:hypothetical protein
VNSSRDDLLEKLVQIEEQARASAGEDVRLIRDRMKFIARLANYLRRQVQVSWSQDVEATLPLDTDVQAADRQA